MSESKRKTALKLAAAVMVHRTDEPLIPNLWSAAVFFEQYLSKGARGTVRDFGPKKPQKLKVVR